MGGRTVAPPPIPAAEVEGMLGFADTSASGGSFLSLSFNAFTISIASFGRACCRDSCGLCGMVGEVGLNDGVWEGVGTAGVALTTGAPPGIPVGDAGIPALLRIASCCNLGSIGTYNCLHLLGIYNKSNF